MNVRVFVLGSSGMAGHAIALTLHALPTVAVIDAGPRRKVFRSSVLVNLADPRAVQKTLENNAPDVVVNCVGALVKRSEENPLESIWLNAYLPHLLSEYCARGARRLIHLSTDCVFSGKNGPYVESAFRDGDMVYDRTKSLGEVARGRDLTIRTSIVGPELSPSGTGLFNWFMMERGPVRGYSHAQWSGVTTVQLAKFIAHLALEDQALSGLIHYTTPGGISKLDLLRVFNSAFGRGTTIDAVETPVSDKRLIDTRRDFQCTPPDYETQVREMREWMHAHGDLYPHYLRWL